MSNEITIKYPNGEMSAQVVDLLVRKRPVGWGRKSYPTYYKLEYALQLKKELDAMMVDKKARVFRLTSMPHLTMNSIYLWTNQAFHYLIDFMDVGNHGQPAGTYRILWNQIRTERIKGTGVIIKYLDYVTDTLVGETFVAREDKVKWRSEMDIWLEDDTAKKPFHKDGLLLNPEEIAQLKSELEDLGNIQFSVTSKELKIIKVL